MTRRRLPYRWRTVPADPREVRALASELGLSEVLARCLVQRGVSAASAGSFLQPRLQSLSDPFELPGMRAAVDRLRVARARRERVVLFGDYDVDGVTATAQLQETLSGLGWIVGCYLPRRLDEGYGLSAEAVRSCRDQHHPQVLVAIDCGSTSTEVIRHLQAEGTEVVVLDHHQVADPGPPACALVNPQLLGEGHPARHLSSAGLAFKLAHALVKEGRVHQEPAEGACDVRRLLDLVALGTVADLVPLCGENRVLVAAGLRYLESTPRAGLQALMEVAQVSRPVGAHEVGFQLGPRLNAAGRLEDATRSLELVLTPNPEAALRLARELDTQNRERQRIEREISTEVIESVRPRFRPEADWVIVEGNSDWHIGVVGIVASRVSREFYRPTVILGGDGPDWRGSGRSVTGFDLAAALRGCDDLLVRHGGHAMAAGLSLCPTNLEFLRERLNGLARQSLQPDDLVPVLSVDAEIRLDQWTPALAAELEQLSPFGQGNPALHLMLTGVSLSRPARAIGRGGDHVRLELGDGAARAEVLWWGGAQEPKPEGPFDAVVRVARDRPAWGGGYRLELIDWRSTPRGVG